MPYPSCDTVPHSRLLLARRRYEDGKKRKLDSVLLRFSGVHRERLQIVAQDGAAGCLVAADLRAHRS